MPGHEWSVHIVPIGFKTLPINVIHKFRMNVDRVYLLHGSDVREYETLDEIKREFADIDVEVFDVPVDPFDFDDIMDSMLTCVEDERDRVDRLNREERDAASGENRRPSLHSVRFYLNITNGTRLMSGAATEVAYLTGSAFYYVMDTRDPAVRALPVEEQVKVIEAPKRQYLESLKGFDRELLEFIVSRPGGVTYADIEARFGRRS